MDIQYLLFLQGVRQMTGSIFDGFFLFLSSIGVGIIPMLISAGVYWCINKRIGIYLMMNGQWAAVLNGFIKLTAGVYRPWIRNAELIPVVSAVQGASGYSFPSGHTARAIATWGGLAVVNRNHLLLRNCCIAVFLLIGFSRNYLGVHTPQDVIASLVIGSMLLLISYRILQWVDAREGRDIYLMLAGIVLSFILIAYADLKSYSLDYIDGILIVDPVEMMLDSFSAAGALLGLSFGWFCERRWICFSISGGNQQKLARFLIGAFIVLLLMYSGKMIFILLLGDRCGMFISSAVNMLFITLIYPICFIWAE
jgi:membrane-associated phospholipid phosphatase